MSRAAHEIVTFGLRVLLVLATLGFTVSTFGNDDKPCTEENPCEEVVVTGSKPLPPTIENPLPIHHVNTTDSALPQHEDCTVVIGGLAGTAPDSDCDGIADHHDDCSQDPSNTDPECLDDLPNCNEAVGWALASVGGWSALGSLIGTKVTLPIVGVVTVGSISLVAGGVIVGAGAAYCFLAYVEG